MRQVKRRSALPVYIAAAVYAVCAFTLPMYKLWHFLMAALITAAAWLAADKLIKPRIEYVPEPEPEPVSHGATVDALLAEAAKAHGEMEKLSASIGEQAVSEKIAALISLSDRIAQDAVDDSADVPAIQKFQSYFLPSTIGLLHAYDRMSAQNVAGENISGAKSRIQQMLDTEIQAFQKQLDALYRNDAMDVDADIKVMESLLTREGLSPDGDRLEELLRQARAGAGDGKNTHKDTDL